jgi:outer membrane biosynthesis protein TonB
MKFSQSINGYVKLSVILLLLFTGDFVVATAQSAPQNAEAKILSLPEFHLSDAAIAAGIDGKIKIRVTVDKSGAVKDTRIIGGPAWPCGSKPKKELEDVLSAVKQNVSAARFSPAVKDGKPVSTDLVLTFPIGNAYKQAVKQREAEEAASSGAALPKIVESGVLNGKALRLPPPEYSGVARARRLSGAVPIEVLIDERGRVVLAGALGGHPVLQASARDSACGARFAPIVLKGQPIKVTGVIIYSFTF